MQLELLMFKETSRQTLKKNNALKTEEVCCDLCVAT